MKPETRRAQRAALRAAKREIAARYAEADLDLASVGAAAGVSPRQLQRIFREHAGVTFRAFLLDVRMRRAIALLWNGWSSVRVARAVSYSRSGLRLALYRHSGGHTSSHFQGPQPDYDADWRGRESIREDVPPLLAQRGNAKK